MTQPNVDKQEWSSRQGMTLLEIVLAMAIMTVVFASIVPILGHARRTWDAQEGAADMLQNGRVLVEHFMHQVSEANEVTAVTDGSETNGYLQLKDAEGTSLRYELASSYVRFGEVGDLSNLAGPVSLLQFTCYDACDLDTPITDVNSIRYVKIQATFTNTAPEGRDMTVSAGAYLRTNWETGTDTGDLVGWWKLDDGSGTTAVDSSGNNNNGTLHNMNADTDWVSGRFNGALDFDGYNDYVSLPIGEVINGLTDCTISGWTNWSGSGSIWQRVFDFGAGESVNMFLTPNASGDVMRFAMTDTGYWDEDQATASSALPTGWHHVAVTIDPNHTTHLLYLDGEVVAQNTSARFTPSDLGETDQNWLARSQYSADPYFDGMLDDVRIYNRVLTADEISGLMGMVCYQAFTEAKVGSEGTSVTIPTPASASAVGILGSWTSGLSHTVESGSNRALVLIAHAERAGSIALNSVTYGGQSMTKVVERSVNSSGVYDYVVSYVLDEAGVAAAASSTFSPSWSYTSGASLAYSSVFLQNVNQSTLIGSTVDNATTGSNPITSSGLTTSSGDMVIDAATCGNASSYTLNNGFTEGIDQTMGGTATGVTGYKLATGATETPSATYDSVINRQVLIGFVVQGSGTIDTVEDDLLIAAVATDGDTSASLTPPPGEDWTEIDTDCYSNAVTLGVWWKLAGASEAASHQFTWTGSQQAYGWMMRFTGHDADNPIHNWTASGSISSTPASPAVTTTVDNCLILRLGAFDGSEITIDDPGLSGHTAVTMDVSNNETTASMVGYWALDESSGTTAADSSGNGHDGTLVNMSSFSDWVTGQIGNALDFDGYNDYVSLPIGSVIGSLRNCTIAVWVNWDGGNVWQRIWDFGSSETVNMFLTPKNGDDNRLRFVITTSGRTGEERTDASTALSSGWHHVVVTIDADNTTHTLYVDGTQVGQNTSGSHEPDDLGSTTHNYLARSQYSADPYFNGRLDDVRIYNVTLSADEVAELASWSGETSMVSGGAGYVEQSSSGSSGTSTFSLTASEQAQVLTIAIAAQSVTDVDFSGVAP